LVSQCCYLWYRVINLFDLCQLMFFVQIHAIYVNS
jgi:hypothetical protein